MTSIITLVLLHLSFLSIIKTEIIPLCETLKDIQGDEDDSSVKLRRTSALCDDLEASRGIADQEDSDLIPDFDLNQIDSENDVNQILKRFRRGRSSSSSGGRSSSSGSRFSSSSSRSSSSGGSRFFGGSRSSSSSSGGSSRIFSRGSSSSSSSSSGSRGGIFSRSGTGTASSNHRVRETIRSVIRKPTSSGSGSSGLSGTGGSKPSLTDKIRKITHGSGSSGGSRFGTGGLSGSGGGGFGTGSSSGSGGNVWVRAGKTFLPHAVRFGKRYYQRRKYNKGMYAGMGAGAGYYAGSGMNNHHGHYYPHNNYGYPPNADQPPAQVDGQTPTVFYCLQQDLNATLVNKTLDDEGFGVCNVSGKLLTCPIEIECKTSEADNCCEDEQGTPYCCGGPIPVEYMSQNGGYGDDWDDATDSLNKLLNVITAICLMMATICFTVWQQRE